MNSDRSGAEQNWLRSFMFTIYGTSVLAVSYFPLFYSQLGFSNAQLGMLYAIGPLISMLSNLFWSMLSDRFGTVKKILYALLAGQIATGVLLAGARDFPSAMLILSFFYFFYYPVFPLADTLAIKTAERLGRNFIVIRVFGSIGYSFFALTAGYLLRRIGASYSVAACVVVAALALLITFRLEDTKKSPPVKTSDRSEESGGWKEVFLSREVLWFFGCVFIMAISYRMNEAFLTVSLRDLGAGEELVGWSLLASALSEIPILFLAGRYGERFKELPLLALASLMFALRFFLMSAASQPMHIVAIQALHSVSFGLYYVTAIRYITRLIPDRLRATGMALYTVAWSSASGLLSGAFGGLLYDQAGRTVFFRTASALALTASFGFLLKHLLPDRPAVQLSALPAAPAESDSSQKVEITV
ncbi:MFS transporter [Paenibacillus glufosinatiresistens]|uniref:MFS transporter n=1 Tax=Paenibacillus glufosinatiresistens TaxID=3070657 RepID=UPI00286E5795|nr:MFS transporter [Paenibacillus sp. YX.27]